eukprot:gene4132-8209_t
MINADTDTETDYNLKHAPIINDDNDNNDNGSEYEWKPSRWIDVVRSQREEDHSFQKVDEKFLTDTHLQEPSEEALKLRPVSPRTRFLVDCVAGNIPPRPAYLIRSDVLPKLDLSRHYMGDKVAQMLSNALLGLPLLAELDMSENKLSDVGIVTVIEKITVCSELRILNLSGNKVEKKGIQAIATYLNDENCQLTTLVMRNTSLDDYKLRTLFKAISENTNTKLVHIDVGQNSIGSTEATYGIHSDVPSGGVIIGEYLSSTHCKLQILKVDWNMIRAESAVKLARGLKLNSSLLELDVSYNGFGLHGGEMIGDALTVHKSLVRLGLAQNNIQPRACVTLVTGIRCCNTLKHVDLSLNPIGLNGAQSLMSLKTYVGDRVDINIRECSIKSLDKTCWFDSKQQSNLIRPFSLDLSKPYERSIFIEITYIIVDTSSLKFKSCKYTTDGSSESSRGSTQELNLIVKVESKPEVIADIGLATGIAPKVETIHEIANDVKTAQKVFKQFDLDKNGCLDRVELAELLKYLGLLNSAHTIDQLLALYDTDGSGLIEESEFVGFLEEVQKSAIRFQARGKELRYVALSDSSMPYIVPDKGKLEFEIESDESVPSFLDKMSKSTVDKLMSNANSSNSNSILDYALTSMKFSAADAVSIMPIMLKEFGNKMTVLIKLLPRMISPLEARLFISTSLGTNIKDKLVLKNALEPLYRPLLGLVNGYYNLNLSQELDRKCLQLLIETNETAIAERKRLMGDVSQYGDWSCFRNLVIDNKVVRQMSLVNTLSAPAKVHFDFSTTAYVGIDSTPISDFRFLNVLAGLGMIDESEKSITYSRISRLDTDAKEAAHGIGLREFCLTMRSSEIAVKHRHLFYETLTKRTLDNELESILLDMPAQSQSIAQDVIATLNLNMDGEGEDYASLPLSLESRVLSTRTRRTSSGTDPSPRHSITTLPMPTNRRSSTKAPNPFMKNPATSRASTPGRKLRQVVSMDALEADYSETNYRAFLHTLADSTSLVEVAKAKRMIDALQDTLGGRLLSCAQLAILCDKIPAGDLACSIWSSIRVELIISFFSQLVDPINFEVVLKSILAVEIGMIHCRLGLLTIWNPLKPEGYIYLDISRREERQIFRMLILLSVVEPGQNWLDQGCWATLGKITQGSHWQLPPHWLTENGMVTNAIVRIRYYSGEGSGFSECAPDLPTRLAMMSLVYSQPYTHDVRFTHKPTLERAEILMNESGIGLSFLPEKQKVLRNSRVQEVPPPKERRKSINEKLNK